MEVATALPHHIRGLDKRTSNDVCIIYEFGYQNVGIMQYSCYYLPVGSTLQGRK